MRMGTENVRSLPYRSRMVFASSSRQPGPEWLHARWSHRSAICTAPENEASAFAWEFEAAFEAAFVVSAAAAPKAAHARAVVLTLLQLRTESPQPPSAF